MGCLNSNQGFEHWFGNIHLSGPCNRECYFCIGQHMMALDSQNNLDRWPLNGTDEFIQECQNRNVNEINLTGTNTEPLLFKHHEKLIKLLRDSIPELKMGLRTNGALILSKPEVWQLYDKASITLPSFDQDIYVKQMGRGSVPDIKSILELDGPKDVKVNVVLGPENFTDVQNTLDRLSALGIKKVNLREPYGQPFVGDPLKSICEPVGKIFGMPKYSWKGIDVVYWDVHYVHVESVNLYAQGKVSLTYPITLGHDDNTGKVVSQEYWKKRGRHVQQWVS